MESSSALYFVHQAHLIINHTEETNPKLSTTMDKRSYNTDTRLKAHQDLMIIMHRNHRLHGSTLSYQFVIAFLEYLTIAALVL